MLSKIKDKKILVIGDLMLDHYIWGDATRISPEAPVPVVHVDRDSYVCGGAANAACNLAGLGAQTILLGSYGSDEGGHTLAALLAEQGIQLMTEGCRKECKTIVKTRVVVQRQQMCRLDRELPPDEYHLNGYTQSPEFQALLEDIDAVLLSDYAKGTLDDALLDILRKVGKKAPLLVMDPKPKRNLNLSGLDLMTPNRSEALQLAGLPYDHYAPFEESEVVAKIFEKYKPRNLVITLGSDGMLVCESAKNYSRLPTEAREVFDVSGAGDTVVATLTAALACGDSLQDAAALANKAAGIVVARVGTSPLRNGELKK